MCEGLVEVALIFHSTCVVWTLLPLREGTFCLVEDPESSRLGEVLEDPSAPPATEGLLLSGAAARKMRSSAWIWSEELGSCRHQSVSTQQAQVEQTKRERVSHSFCCFLSSREVVREENLLRVFTFSAVRSSGSTDLRVVGLSIFSPFKTMQKRGQIKLKNHPNIFSGKLLNALQCF